MSLFRQLELMGLIPCPYPGARMFPFHVSLHGQSLEFEAIERNSHRHAMDTFHGRSIAHNNKS